MFSLGLMFRTSQPIIFTQMQALSVAGLAGFEALASTHQLKALVRFTLGEGSAPCTFLLKAQRSASCCCLPHSTCRAMLVYSPKSAAKRVAHCRSSLLLGPVRVVDLAGG